MTGSLSLAYQHLLLLPISLLAPGFPSPPRQLLVVGVLVVLIFEHTGSRQHIFVPIATPAPAPHDCHPHTGQISILRLGVQFPKGMYCTGGDSKYGNCLAGGLLNFISLRLGVGIKITPVADANMFPKLHALATCTHPLTSFW